MRTALLQRPRTLGFHRAARVRGLGDASDFLAFEGNSGGSVPAATGSNFDFGDLALGTPPASSGGGFDFAKAASDVVRGAQTYYGAQTAINNANYSAQLAKAQAQAAINIAKAGGQNATQTARAGLPSPTLLLAAGIALAAVVLLKR